MNAPAHRLSRRSTEVVFVAFWAINFGFITYMIDIEQIVIPDPVAAPALVVGANLPWLLFPSAVIWRMRREDPFAYTAEATS